MCMTLEALVLFLNLLPDQIIETAPDAITIHATAQDTVWLAAGDVWCTDGPSAPVLAQAPQN